jgi:hypothetical protein
MIQGTDKGTFIPIACATVPKGRQAVDKRYARMSANFLFNKEPVIPFGGEWEAPLCRMENLFKEISNRGLAVKHAM